MILIICWKCKLFDFKLWMHMKEIFEAASLLLSCCCQAYALLLRISFLSLRLFSAPKIGDVFVLHCNKLQRSSDWHFSLCISIHFGCVESCLHFLAVADGGNAVTGASDWIDRRSRDCSSWTDARRASTRLQPRRHHSRHRPGCKNSDPRKVSTLCYFHIFSKQCDA